MQILETRDKNSSSIGFEPQGARFTAAMNSKFTSLLKPKMKFTVDALFMNMKTHSSEHEG